MKNGKGGGVGMVDAFLFFFHSCSPNCHPIGPSTARPTTYYIQVGSTLCSLASNHHCLNVATPTQCRQERPYNHENATSCLLCEAKHDLAGLVLRWGTTLEYSVLFFSFWEYHLCFTSNKSRIIIWVGWWCHEHGLVGLLVLHHQCIPLVLLKLLPETVS